MKTDKATARPWTVLESCNSNLIHIESRHEECMGDQIATVNKGNKEQRLANGELIVKAVNLHEELVKACENCLSMLTQEWTQNTKLARLAQINSVLAKAKGNQCPT